MATRKIVPVPVAAIAATLLALAIGLAPAITMIAMADKIETATVSQAVAR